MVKKLKEFAKNGQKDTDKLDLEAGFPVNLKPARQWFNFIFNELTRSINQIIDEDYIRHNELVNNLTTDDKSKPLTAAQGKKLQDEKAPLNNPVLTGIASTPLLKLDRSLYPRIEFSPSSNGDNGAIFECSGNGYPYIAIRPKASLGASAGQIAHFAFPIKTGNHTLATLNDNVASASKLNTPRKINKVDFDGGSDINIEAPQMYRGNIGSIEALDLAIESGVYVVSNYAVAGLYNYGFLQVYRVGNVCAQVYFPHNSSGGNNNVIALRQTWTQGGIGSAKWTLLGDSDNSKLSITGGTITGGLTVKGELSTERISGSAAPIAFLTGGSARGINIGQLLVSDQYRDVSKVPLYGAYLKGSINTDSALSIGQRNGAKDGLFHERINLVPPSHSGVWNVGLFDDASNANLLIKYGNNNVLSADHLGNVTAKRFIGGLSGNASSATKLEIARTVQFSGAATGSFTTDFSGNSSCILTLANSGVVAGTYGNNITIPVITFNAKGQATVASTQTIRAATTGQTGVVQLNDTLTSTAANQALTAAQGKKLQDEKLGKNENAVSAEKLRLSGTAHITSGETGWVHFATATIPQAGGSVKIEFTGGQGFNAGSLTQCPLQTVVLRTGNGNPATGINCIWYRIDGLNNFLNVSCVPVGANKYEVWINAAPYTKTQWVAFPDSASTIDIEPKPMQKDPPDNLIRSAGYILPHTGSNIASATKLEIARTVQFSGAANGSFTTDFSGNSSCILTLANSGVVAGTYGNNVTIPVITVDAKGLVTVVSNQAIRAATTGQTGIVQLNDTLTSTAANQALTAAQGKKLQDEKLGKNENAVSASKLQTARKFSISGTLSGNATFDGSGDIDVKVSNAAGLGINQRRIDMTSQRAANTTYINTLPHPIQLQVTVRVWHKQTATMIIDGEVKASTYVDVGSGGSVNTTYEPIIVSGESYSVTGSIVSWWELR